MTTTKRPDVLTLEEAMTLGLPEEVVTDIKWAVGQRGMADAMIAEAKKLTDEATPILMEAMQLYTAFAKSWNTDEVYGEEIKSVTYGDRLVTLVAQGSSSSLNKDALKQYLVGKGVEVEVVAAAFAAATSTSAPKTPYSIRVAKA